MLQLTVFSTFNIVRSNYFFQNFLFKHLQHVSVKSCKSCGTHFSLSYVQL